jgi:TonB family protein
MSGYSNLQRTEELNLFSENNNSRRLEDACLLAGIGVSVFLHVLALALNWGFSSVARPHEFVPLRVTFFDNIRFADGEVSATTKIQRRTKVEKAVPLQKPTRPDTAPPETTTTAVLQVDQPPSSSEPENISNNLQEISNGAETENHSNTLPDGIGDFRETSKLTLLPRLITQIEPEYPKFEREMGTETTVMAELFINEAGAVQLAKIEKSGGKNFDKSVLKAIDRFKFAPGYIGKNPVPVRLRLSFVFKLQ